MEFWLHDLKAPEYVCNIVKFGYLIPFFQRPTSAHFTNNKSAINHADFVNKVILELIGNGVVVEAEFPPFVVNPLTVPVNAAGKEGLILDLRGCTTGIRNHRTRVPFVQV